MDSHQNFARSTVATAPSPASSGTSLVVASGDGALFPTPPFNVTIWPAGTQPTSANAEIARVTGISTDTFTITRTTPTESPTYGPRTILVGDQLAATITKKTLTDIEALLGTGAVTLLGAATGNSTSGSAANVYTLAISGLTKLDTLEIVVTMETTGGTTTTTPSLYNATDSVAVVAPGVNINTGFLQQWHAVIGVDANSNTNVQSTLIRGGGTGVGAIAGRTSTFTTSFVTSTWNLALRHDGTDGTFHFTISVYKKAGQ